MSTALGVLHQIIYVTAPCILSITAATQLISVYVNGNPTSFQTASDWHTVRNVSIPSNYNVIAVKATASGVS